MKNEIWKNVVGWHDSYMVSNLGRVKSIGRLKFINGVSHFKKEGFLKPILDNNGYLYVNLSYNGKRKKKAIHQLVAESFLGHKVCGHKAVVNHKNFDKTDSRLDNLEIVTARENTNKKHLKSSSEHVGVSWDEKSKKWRARITFNNKTIHAGFFTCEIEAAKAYQKRLKEIQTEA